MAEVQATGEAAGKDGGKAPHEGAVSAPLLGAVGIGVTDLARSFSFYTEVLGMQLGYDLNVPGYADEKIMVFKGSKGASVVLMKYTDGIERNYRNNPIKLVFYVPNAAEVLARVEAAGYDVPEPATPRPAFNNTIVGFGRDPDGYLIEVVENPALEVPVMAAVGIGVQDLTVSQAFYEKMFEMKILGGLIQVPNRWDEVILRHSVAGGASIVPMHWTDGTSPNYKNVPVKLVHYVPDMRATTEAIRSAGLKVLTEPKEYNVHGTKALIALARDPDGYVMELVTRLPADA